MKLYFISSSILVLFICSCSSISEVSQKEIPYETSGDSTDVVVPYEESLPQAPEPDEPQQPPIVPDTAHIQPTYPTEPDPIEPPKVSTPTSAPPSTTTPPVNPPKPPTSGTVVITPKPSEKKPEDIPPPVFEYRNISRDAYRTGEKLTFDINLGFITAGSAVMAVENESTYHNRRVQKISMDVRTSRGYSWIYSLEDQYISLTDKYGVYPVKVTRKIREKSYKFDQELEFDHAKGIVKDGQKTYEIPAYTLDILTAFYYVRNYDLRNKKAGDIIQLKNYSDGQVHPLDVRIVGWQQVKVPVGTYNCVVLEPIVVAGGLVKNEGSMLIWLTNDHIRMPVKIEFKLMIGSIKGELTKIEGIDRPIPAKVK